MLGKMGGLLGAAIYGAGRAKMSNALAPLTNRIPLGGISDEVGMILAAEAAKKFIGNRIPMVRQIATSGQYIEAARIGEAVISGQVGLGGSSGGGGNLF